MRRIATFALTLLLLSATVFAAKPLATVSSNAEGLEIDLMSVERKGNVVTVKWAVRNTGTENATAAFGLAGNGPTTYLVDEENGTKYYALTDKEGHVLATMHEYVNGKYGISETVKPGTTKRYWAKFPAPPPAVKAITVLFSDAEPIEDVAIADK